MIVLLFGMGCVGGGPLEPAPLPGPSGVVTFDGRTVDLAQHLAGYPYQPELAVPEIGLLLYDRHGPTRELMRAPQGTADLDAGTPVSTVDWSTRTRWELRHRAADDALYFLGDERNDEVINLWRLSLADGALTRLTEEPYLYGWSFDEAEERVAIVARRGEGPYTSCVETLRPDGSERKSLVCDTPAAELSWSAPAWAPDAGGVVVTVKLEGRRDRRNLAWVALDHPELRLLLDPAKDRTSTAALSPWLDADRFVAISDETGLGQLYVYDVRKGTSSSISSFDRDLSSALVMEPTPGRKLVIALLQRPDEAQVVSVDPSSGDVLDRLVVQGEISSLGDDGVASAVLKTTSGRAPLEISRLVLSPEGKLALTPWIAPPAETTEELVRCNQEKVSIPTFDVDPATGKQRELHAFLYTPKDPPKEGRALARVLSFYGGQDEWNTEIQVFCDAGITTLSPSPRGSRGFGTAFYRLNDGDLGGDEIVDVFHAARWLETRGYAADHIGVYGRSHGGYATMRAMTFPPATNGRNASYPWAFGLSDAGFSDIVTFWEASNIPDWVVLEAGDPVTERAELLDRSPISHVDLLAAPLFLAHGENDNRVPVAESRRFAEACATAGKDCTYVEFAGQGHQVKGLANETALYQAKLHFLEAKVLAAPQDSPAP